MKKLSPFCLLILVFFISMCMNEHQNEIEKFENKIQQHEDQLFGISLYYQGILFLYSDNDEIIQMNKTAYQNVMERGNRTIQEAKEILEEVKKNPQQIDLIQRFEFPPIHGIGLDEMTQRATLLINAYNKLFPDRPRNTPLSHEEHTRLVQEAINKF